MAKRKTADSSPADENAASSKMETQNERVEILSKVESFLDFDLAAMRHKLIDDLIVGKFHDELGHRIADLPGQDQINALVQAIAETKAEIHYLKAAYVERTRYVEPKFNISTPQLPAKLRPDVFDIDLRGLLTGGNWWEAEPDGRWAGPANQSSIQFPALGDGIYSLEVTVLGEADNGVLEGTQITLNHNPVTFSRVEYGFPCQLNSQVEVPKSYKFPFWALKFDFSKLASPREKGFEDNRRLAIKLQHIRFTRLTG